VLIPQVRQTMKKRKNKMVPNKPSFCTNYLINKKLIFVFFYCLILFLGFYFRFGFYSSFLKSFEKGFTIPGLSEDFIPQGIAVVDSNHALVSGYRQNHLPSPVYLVNTKTSKVEKCMTFELENGTKYSGHGGGIACFQDHVWVASDSKLYHFSYSEFLTSTNCRMVDSKVQVNSNFLFEDGTYLYIGEFYRENGYETIKDHWFTTQDETNPALIEAHRLNDASWIGYEEKIEFCYSIPKEVQGVCIKDNHYLYLSCSYGRMSSSTLKEYDLEKVNSEYSIKLGEKHYPLYFLGKDSLLSTKDILPMSEDLDLNDGRIYVMFESGASKFWMGKYPNEACYIEKEKKK
jgi:hypothetical protein